jgi:hypothetical protein
MKIHIVNKIIIFFGLAFIFSCRQDPIFFTISTETVPKKPRIEGSPTNIAVFKRNGVPVMYVASGSLHWYARMDGGSADVSGWDLPEYGIPQPGGNIIGLAATDSHLYALCLSGSGVDTVLRRIGHDEEVWKDVQIGEANYTSIQVIYADTGMLFAGASSGLDFGILYLKDDAASVQALQLLEGNTGMLSGAASRNHVHYLSTRGKGVYKVAEDDISSVTQLAELVPKTDEDGNASLEEVEGNRLFMGMIQLAVNGPIIVVERNGGAFFEVKESGFRLLRYSNGDAVVTGRFATGALALWLEVTFDDDGTPQQGDKKMLIAGIQGGLFNTTTSSYTHGYVEIELDSDFTLNDEGWLVFNSVRRDISPSITVHGNTDRYTAGIGKRPINHLFQAPTDIDTIMTFFASTQTAGLWSYRDRANGGWQWNAED